MADLTNHIAFSSMDPKLILTPTHQNRKIEFMETPEGFPFFLKKCRKMKKKKQVPHSCRNQGEPTLPVGPAHLLLLDFTSGERERARELRTEKGLPSNATPKPINPLPFITCSSTKA
jgi:hypothetical protein